MGPVRPSRRARAALIAADLGVHLLLTDRLTCTRCGPGFGLILRADRMQGRNVLEGALGCSNCRDAYPIAGGFADLRPPPRRAPAPGRAGEPGGLPAPEADAEATRLVALLGVPRGPGTIVLVGAPARHGAAVAAAVPDIQVAAVDPDLRSWPEEAGVSRLEAGPALPFFPAGMRAVAIDGRLGPETLAEAARVVAPRGRVVVVHAPGGVRERLSELGLSVLATEAETVVATRG